MWQEKKVAPEEIEDLQKELIRLRAELAESEDVRARLVGWMERCTAKLNQYGRLSAKDNYAQDVIHALNDLDVALKLGDLALADLRAAKQEIERLKGTK
jgi:hypothetical protein